MSAYRSLNWLASVTLVSGQSLRVVVAASYIAVGMALISSESAAAEVPDSIPISQHADSVDAAQGVDAAQDAAQGVDAAQGLMRPRIWVWRSSPLTSAAVSG